MARTAYARKGEAKEHDKRDTPDGIDGQTLREIDAALDRWASRQRDFKPKQEVRVVFVRRWQVRVTQPLWILLAKAELAKAIEEGKAHKPSESSEGWEEQVFDGDKKGSVPLG